MNNFVNNSILLYVYFIKRTFHKRHTVRWSVWIADYWKKGTPLESLICQKESVNLWTTLVLKHCNNKFVPVMYRNILIYLYFKALSHQKIGCGKIKTYTSKIFMFQLFYSCKSKWNEIVTASCSNTWCVEGVSAEPTSR